MLEADLGMLGTMNYNVALSVYFLTYCTYLLPPLKFSTLLTPQSTGSFEVPANLMLKYLRPATWLSLITVAWGIVMMGTFRLEFSALQCLTFHDIAHRYGFLADIRRISSLPTHAGYYGSWTLSWSYFSAHCLLSEA